MRFYDTVRLILTTRLNNYDIADATGVGETTVRRYRRLVTQKGLTWPDLERLDYNEFDRVFNKPARRPKSALVPDLAQLEAQLTEHRMPMQIWWEDQWSRDAKSVISYSYLAKLLRQHRQAQPSVMRQTHIPGEKVFVDYSGKRPFYVCRATGERTYVELFVGVLGGSSLTFALASATQRIPDFLHAHVEMFKYFGGVPEVIVPDNLASAVTRKGTHVEVQRSYAALAKHYRSVVLPARPRRPKDKAKAEAGVKFVQQHILSRLNQQTFYSLDEINAAIVTLLEQANSRPMARKQPSRRERFETTERARLQPLPEHSYDYAEWVTIAKVGQDYHVPVQGHFYSVPHALVGAAVEARISNARVEIFQGRTLVASHARSEEVGAATTADDHRTPEHRAQAGRTPERLMTWAEDAGEHVIRFVRDQFDQDRRFLGLKPSEEVRKLAKVHGAAALDRAIERAYAQGSANVTTVRRLLGNASPSETERKRPRNARSAATFRGDGHVE
jgi:transposase